MYGRVRGSYTWRDKHQVYLLYAPLSLNGTGRLTGPISFQGTTFTGNARHQMVMRDGTACGFIIMSGVMPSTVNGMSSWR